MVLRLFLYLNKEGGTVSGQSRFKGLSILMNMRDVGIERTMKQIRAQFKTLDSEMRRSNANFKNSEKTCSLMQQERKN